MAEEPVTVVVSDDEMTPTVVTDVEGQPTVLVDPSAPLSIGAILAMIAEKADQAALDAEVDAREFDEGIYGGIFGALDGRVTAIETALPGLEETPDVDSALTRITALEQHETFAMVGDPQKALARWRMALGIARGGNGFATLVMMGDSIIEGFYCSSTYYRMSDILRRRLAWRSYKSSLDLGNALWCPAVSGNGSGTGWPGPAGAGFDPWVRTGVTANQDNLGGPGLACVVMNPGSKMSAQFVGNQIFVVYAKDANAGNGNYLRVTIDGVVQGNLNPNKGITVWNTVSPLYTAPGGYGLHTVDVEYTGPGGFLIFEGIYIFQNVAGGGIALYNYGNGGTEAAQWATAGAGAWDNILSLNGPGAMLINLGTNDATFGRTPAQFEASMKTIIDRCEARWVVAGLTDPKPGYVFTFWPSGNMLPRSDWWAAFKNLVAYVPNGRAVAIDMLAEMGDVSPAVGTLSRTAILTDGVHPGGDQGQFWFADVMEKIFDPSPPPSRVRHSQLIGTAGAGTVNIYHELGTTRCKAVVTREATGVEVPIRVTYPATNYVTLDFDTYARAANEFRVMIS